MSKQNPKDVAGAIFDETTVITLSRLCEVCSVEPDLVEALIDEGILEPIVDYHDEPRFTYTSVRITRTAMRLQDDLGVNLPGAALALDLLDRIEALQKQLRRKERRIK